MAEEQVKISVVIKENETIDQIDQIIWNLSRLALSFTLNSAIYTGLIAYLLSYKHRQVPELKFVLRTGQDERYFTIELKEYFPFASFDEHKSILKDEVNVMSSYFPLREGEIAAFLPDRQCGFCMVRKNVLLLALLAQFEVKCPVLVDFDLNNLNTAHFCEG